jgi:hypothetical protein
MLESPKGQRHQAPSDSQQDGRTPERRGVAEEVAEGNANTDHDKPDVPQTKTGPTKTGTHRIAGDEWPRDLQRSV